MAKHTEGAVHLTSLSLDLTQLQENINTAQNEIAALADSAVQYGEKIRTSLNLPNEQIGLSVDTTKFAKDLDDAQTAMAGFEKSAQNTASNVSKLGTAFNTATKEQEEFFVRAKDANSLAKSYETLQVKIAGVITSLTASKVKDAGMAELIVKAKEAQQQIISTAAEIRDTGTVTEDSYKAFEEFKSVINEISVAFSRFKTGSNEYKGSLNPITESVKKSISSLKTLEKTAVFKTSKDQVAALRARYEEFLNTLKNSGISVGEAKKQLENLQQEFNDLESTVKRGNGTLENWVNKITESAKWQIANSALNLLRQSFGQLTTTIIDTEDAVIELRRVLNDKSLVDSEMTQTLYDIAYEFGQTFDNVQEVAVKFAQTGKTWEETVAATRATMLGLNTAELEVSTATEGLIAVMAQFNVEADDLEEVIDKINITADNFPVTSEKIVAALQRAGGTANAFNMTLEETIATITALAEKTGRSGENIGTALNSLIIFTNKSENLKLFSSLSEEMDNVVKKFQAGSGSVIDVWTQLSKEIGRLSKEQEDALFNSTAFEQFASQFEAEASEYAGTIQQIYGTAGAYRRNYLTVLLQDMSTVEDVMANLTGAIGYSLQENEVAMESFSKKWNQLIVSAKELAIQFGEAGFLDLMKDIVDVTSAVLKLTKSIGGLRTIMLALTTVILMIKRQKFEKTLTTIGTSFNRVTLAGQMFVACLRNGSTVSRAFAVALGTLKLSMGDLVAIAGIAVTAISAITNATNEMKEKQKQERQETIQSNSETAKSFENILSAYKKYRDLYNQGEDIEATNKARSELLNLLGKEEEFVHNLAMSEDELLYSYDAMYLKIKDLTKEEMELAKVRAEVARSTAEAAFQDLDRSFENSTAQWQAYIDAFGEENVWTQLEQISKQTGLSLKEIDEAIQGTITSYDDAVVKQENLNKIILAMSKMYDISEESVRNFIDSLSKNSETIKVQIKVYEDNDKMVKEYSLSLDEAADSSENATEKTDDLDVATKDLEGDVSDLTTEIENLSKAYTELNKKVDSFQSSYKTLSSIVAEYNETGKLSADNLQDLMSLEPEYIQLLDIKNGQLSINKERLDDLIATNDQYLNDLVAMRAADAIDNMMKDAKAASIAGLTIEEYKATLATQGLTSVTLDLVKQLLNAEISADQFKNAVKDAGKNAQISAEYLTDLANAAYDAAAGYGAFYSAQQQGRQYTMNDALMWGYDDPSDPEFIAFMRRRSGVQTNQLDLQRGTLDRYIPSGGTKTGGGGSKSATDKYKAEKDALNELLEVYEHSIFLIEKNEKDSAKAGTDIAAIYKKMQDEVHAQAERYRAQGVSENDELIRNLQEKWKQTTTYIRKEYRAA